MISSIIEDFCQNRGFHGAKVQEGGELIIESASLGNFVFLHRSPRLLVGLTRYVERPDDIDPQRVLGMCHYRQPYPWPLHAKRTEDSLGYAFIFKEDETTVATLSQAWDILVDVMNRTLGTQ